MQETGEWAAVGKPSYDRDRLRQLKVGELEKRLQRIDNEIAHEVAAILWKRIEDIGIFRAAIHGKSTRDLSVAQQAGMGSSVVTRLLKKLRQVQLAECLLADRERLAAMLENMHWSWKMFVPIPPMRDARSRAAFLTNYLECLVPNGWQVSWGINMPLNLFFIAWFLAFNYLFLLYAPWNAPSWQFTTVVISSNLLLHSFFHFKNYYYQLRSIALYISFTDEFVVHEPGVTE
ncbi:MAG: hypothetical protein H7A35_14280 [Planctomycetales bacterium]|nr:hypothetical protein [bacterium]UNM08004.1 MAG: hypothetical protein H7A35_14280 [Planctomycetales bacterium]